MIFYTLILDPASLVLILTLHPPDTKLSNRAAVNRPLPFFRHLPLFLITRVCRVAPLPPCVCFSVFTFISFHLILSYFVFIILIRFYMRVRSLGAHSDFFNMAALDGLSIYCPRGKR